MGDVMTLYALFLCIHGTCHLHEVASVPPVYTDIVSCQIGSVHELPFVLKFFDQKDIHFECQPFDVEKPIFNQGAST
jgi:hypothetical protein